jgi:hypothetical protein
LYETAVKYGRLLTYGVFVTAPLAPFAVKPSIMVLKVAANSAGGVIALILASPPLVAYPKTSLPPIKSAVKKGWILSYRQL